MIPSESARASKTGQLESQIVRKAAACSIIVDARVAVGVEIIGKEGMKETDRKILKIMLEH